MIGNEPKTYSVTTLRSNEITKNWKEGLILDVWKRLDDRPSYLALQNLRE